MARKKSNVSKFASDYPLVIVIALVFAIGVWFGFVIGRKSVPVSRSAKTLPAEVVVTKKPSYHPPEQVSRPVKITPAPFSFKGFFNMGTKPREVRVTPVPKKKEPPKIIFIIDDAGYNKRLAELLFSIQEPLTLAILPQLPYSKYFAEEARKHGLETFLHLPLEPQNNFEDPGQGEIASFMTDEEVREELKRNLDSVPNVTGVNNHMGSKATQDKKLMDVILDELKKRKLFFVDSMTHSKSIAYDEAKWKGIPAFKRDVFLDYDNDPAYIRGQIELAAKIAKQNGFVIAIGHIRQNTLDAIKEAAPGLTSRGYELTTVSSLAETKR